MYETLDIFERIRAKASSENDRLARRFGLASADSPIGALNVIHQQATVSAELVSYYIEWSQDPRNAAPDAAQRLVENNQRVITIGKSALVLSLSAIEWSAKSALSAHPGVLSVGGGHIYLSRIIRRSVKTAFIAAETAAAWDAVIELRNALVHNNAIAQKSRAVSLPDGPRIALAKGQMIQGSIKFLPEVVLWITGAFAKWADTFMSRARAA